MTSYLAGMPVSDRHALAAALRREFHIEGKPLFIIPENIHNRGRTSSEGWTASAFVKSGRSRRPVAVTSRDTVSRCARKPIRLEWTAWDSVIIHTA